MRHLNPALRRELLHRAGSGKFGGKIKRWMPSQFRIGKSLAIIERTSEPVPASRNVIANRCEASRRLRLRRSGNAARSQRDRKKDERDDARDICGRHPTQRAAKSSNHGGNEQSLAPILPPRPDEKRRKPGLNGSQSRCPQTMAGSLSPKPRTKKAPRLAPRGFGDRNLACRSRLEAEEPHAARSGQRVERPRIRLRK